MLLAYYGDDDFFMDVLIDYLKYANRDSIYLFSLPDNERSINLFGHKNECTECLTRFIFRILETIEVEFEDISVFELRDNRITVLVL